MGNFQCNSIGMSYGGSSSSSKVGAAVSAMPAAERDPLKALPLSIQNQIRTTTSKRRLQNAEESEKRVSKWQRKPSSSEENPMDMRSALERRIGEMR